MYRISYIATIFSWVLVFCVSYVQLLVCLFITKCPSSHLSQIFTSSSVPVLYKKNNRSLQLVDIIFFLVYRNEEAAKAQGLQCVSKCDSANSCQNRRKLCLCDGLCGMSCIRWVIRSKAIAVWNVKYHVSGGSSGQNVILSHNVS